MQESRALQGIDKFNNDKVITFKRWMAGILGVGSTFPQGRAIMKKACSIGVAGAPLTKQDYLAIASEYCTAESGITQAAIVQFDVELRLVIEAKIGDDVWLFASTTEEERGLELWRKLNHSFNPKGSKGSNKAIEMQLMALPMMKGPSDVTNGLLQYRRVVTEHNSKAAVGKELTEQTLVVALMRICPKEVTDKIIIDNVEIETSAQLEARLESYRIAHRELDIIHGRGADAMDLSSVSKEAPTTAEAKLLDLERRYNEMSAMMGKGAGGGGSSTKGQPWGGYRPSQGQGQAQGQGFGQGFGKGKGKGKGKSASSIANRRSRETGSQALCPSEAKFGQCTYQQWSGKPCRYQHTKNLPAALSAVEGLVAADLKGLPVTMDLASNQIVVGNCTEEAIAAAVAAAKVQTEKTALEIAKEENDFLIYAASGEVGEMSTVNNTSVQQYLPPGFQGQAIR